MTTLKIAVNIYSDPKAGEEALGRVFNGLGVAYELKEKGDDITIIFQGAGIRWLEVLSKPDHPAHNLFKSVYDKVAGASCGCTDFFGTTDGTDVSKVNLLKDNPLPGTSGVASLRALLKEGYTILTF